MSLCKITYQWSVLCASNLCVLACPIHFNLLRLPLWPEKDRLTVTITLGIALLCLRGIKQCVTTPSNGNVLGNLPVKCVSFVQVIYVSLRRSVTATWKKNYTLIFFFLQANRMGGEDIEEGHSFPRTCGISARMWVMTCRGPTMPLRDGIPRSRKVFAAITRTCLT